jgi:site-specific recombinase XerD
MSNGTAPIYLRITVDEERVELSTRRFVLPAKWNSATQKVSGINEEAKMINTYLKTMEQEVFQAHRALIQENKAVTAATLKSRLSGLDITRHYIIDIFRDHNEKIKALIGKQYAPLTLERYETSLHHTQSFINWKYKTPDLDIVQLNYDFIENYAFWLKSVRNCDHNTTMKYLGNFKKIVRICIKKGWLQKDPFFGFSFTLHEVKRTALTEVEIKTIAGKTFGSERVGKVRDIFLFSCYTGLAYADVKKLTKSEIGKGANNQDWIFTSRKKTDTDSRIPLLPEAITILKKYEDDPECTHRGKVLPVLSNQKMNAYLKEIADLCEINKRLTYHLARHTFATTVTLSNGVPMETVSKMLGHKNLRTTQIYAKVLDLKVGADMESLRQRLARK